MKCYVGPEGKTEFLNTSGDVPLVVDVLRASSTIIAALSSGAEKVIPVEDQDEALLLGNKLHAITIGERHGIRIDGFDFGNSPTEMLDADLRGKTLVMTTTNGTRVMVEGGIIASTLNAGAVADQVRGQPHAYLLASGAPLKSDEDRYAAELIERITAELINGMGVAPAVHAVSRSSEGALLLNGIRNSSSGRKLSTFGFGEDIDLICTAINEYTVLPVYRNGLIQLK
ncbi:MAG TPA: 2-phosphosulfolactate phosphatase [Methanocella sp.]|nr:2-phosphosulfolactate phosphatase [Methanocella sp.]